MYISEGFFNNVGANNIVKPVIDAIKDASINDKIDSRSKKFKFVDLLRSILKDLEVDIKKGKLVFEYIANIGNESSKITISLEITEPNNARWTYNSKSDKYVWGSANYTAFNIANNIVDDLYYETKYPSQDSKLRHSIANTIKVTEFKLS